MTYQDYEKEKREFLAFVNSLPHCETFDKDQGVYGSEEMKSFEGRVKRLLSSKKIRGIL